VTTNVTDLEIDEAIREAWTILHVYSDEVGQ